MKCIYALFLLPILFNQLNAQELDSIQRADSIVDMYRFGYSTGEAMAKSGTFIEQNIHGFAGGCSGSCMGYLLALETSRSYFIDRPYSLLVPTIVGGVITGGLLFYGETKYKSIPYDSSSVDSLFFAGFKDGYSKISKSKRLNNVIAGCCGGITIVALIIIWGITTFSDIH